MIMTIWKAIAKVVSNVADKLQQTDLPKVPRWWDTNMSPAMDTSFLDSMKRWSELSERARYQAWYRYWKDWKPLNQWAPLTKAEALEWVLHPVIDTAYFTKDFVKIPVNAARNLYNTAADKINQKASEHNAKAYEKRKANTRKWVLKKKAEPAQYISL